MPFRRFVAGFFFGLTLTGGVSLENPPSRPFRVLPSPALP